MLIIEELLFHSLDDYQYYKNQIESYHQNKNLFAKCGVFMKAMK